jgi:hypothetical protein
MNIMTLAALAWVVLSGAAPVQPGKEISVERINIVSPEGKTVLAISNKQRIAPPSLDGKEYSVGVSPGRESMAGMIFFNDRGDEMGGLVFNSFPRPDGKYAGIGHLSFDRFNDNQVLALQYKENAQTVQAGLTLYERTSTGAFRTSLDLVDEYLDAEPARRKEIEERLAAMRSTGELGVERAFLGTRDHESLVLLRDSKGRERVKLGVDADDNASLEFFDEAGARTARFPTND